LRKILLPIDDDCKIGIGEVFSAVTIRFEIINNEGRIKLDK